METLAESTRPASGADLREYPRLEVAYSATVRIQGTENVTDGKVVDLSGNGLRLQLSDGPEPGTALSVIMQFDGDTIVSSAEVVWSRREDDDQDFDVACRFID